MKTITLKTIVSFLILILIVGCSCGVVKKRVKNLESEKECLNEQDCYDNQMHPTLKSSSKLFPDHVTVTDGNTKDFWLKNAHNHVNEQIKKIQNENIAKNVIFFIGDGMSLTTLAATRVYIGGEEKSLSFEEFPYTGLVRTYSVDKKTPDSACTSTSYLTGVKANYGTIGVNAHVTRKNCKAMANEDYHTHSIGSWALDAGKVAGFVTTTRVTHASPAGLYAHIADRDWENDSELKNICVDYLDNPNIKDIAYQLIHGKVGSQLKVALGGGRREFCYSDNSKSERKCKRTSDNKNLTKEWLEANKNEKRVYVENRDQLLAVDPLKTDKLLGMFNDGHLLYHLEAEALNKTNEQPTLEEMTRKAIEVMKTHDKGFFLFVEGGKIDLAHHSVLARNALDETAEFSKAIAAARAMTNENDTLIVVSSDHSHTLSISGYPQRHEDITKNAEDSDVDELPYMTLNYANGQAFHNYFDVKNNTRVNPKNVTWKYSKAQFPSTVYLKTETHGGEDVAVFASGPWAHLFTGVYEQNALPHLMAYASCIGNGLKACDDIY